MVRYWDIFEARSPACVIKAWCMVSDVITAPTYIFIQTKDMKACEKGTVPVIWGASYRSGDHSNTMFEL